MNNPHLPGAIMKDGPEKEGNERVPQKPLEDYELGKTYSKT